MAVKPIIIIIIIFTKKYYNLYFIIKSELGNYLPGINVIKENKERKRIIKGEPFFIKGEPFLMATCAIKYQ